MDKRTEQTFFQRVNVDGQQAHEKMLNMVYHQGNANPNYNQMLSLTYQNGHHQKECR